MARHGCHIYQVTYTHTQHVYADTFLVNVILFKILKTHCTQTNGKLSVWCNFNEYLQTRKGQKVMAKNDVYKVYALIWYIDISDIISLM